MRFLLCVAAGLGAVTRDGQGQACLEAYEQEFAPEGGKYVFAIPEDGCYRVDLHMPACGFTPGALDVHFCKGRMAQVAPGMGLSGWVPAGVWPFYVQNGGALEFHGAHDAARVVKVGSLETGCGFAEPRLAAIHLGEVDAAALAADASWLDGWGEDAVVLGVDAANGVVDVELRGAAVVGAIAPLCALAGGEGCQSKAEVYVQERVGDVRQVEPADQRVQLKAAEAKAAPLLALPGALTVDASGQQCDAAYGKAFSPAPKTTSFHIPEDGCYRVEVHQPKGCGMEPGALDVHYCNGMSALGIQPGDFEGWVPIGVWPFYAAKGGRIVQHGPHDAARVVFAGPVSRGCRFQAPTLARIHLAADFGQVTDLVALARRAEQHLRHYGPMKVLGVSEGSVVLDVEFNVGAGARPKALLDTQAQWLPDLCELVRGGEECVAKSVVHVQGPSGDYYDHSAREAGTGAGAFLGAVFGAMVGLLAVAALARYACLRRRRPASAKTVTVLERDAERAVPEERKPQQQDDDVCSTATPSTAPDLGDSLGSGRYTCGKTGLSVSTV